MLVMLVKRHTLADKVTIVLAKLRLVNRYAARVEQDYVNWTHVYWFWQRERF